MVNQEVLDFIHYRLTAGVSRADIERSLTIQGFTKEEIEEGFAIAGSTTVPAPATIAAARLEGAHEGPPAIMVPPHAPVATTPVLAPFNIPETPHVEEPIAATPSVAPVEAPVTPPVQPTLVTTPVTPLVAPVSVDQTPTVTVSSTGAALPGFWKLLGEAWEIVKSRFGVLASLSAIIAVLQIIPALYTTVLGSVSSPVVIPGAVTAVYVFVYLIAYAWCMLAMFFVIKDRAEKVGFGTALGRASHKIHSYWWIYLLTFLAVFGGIVLFIVPGLIFAIWFSFAPMILVAEDLRGRAALRKSREYVRGRLADVLLKFICLSLLSIPLFLVTIVVMVVAVWILGPILGAVFQQIVPVVLFVLLLPTLFAFQFVMYEHLKALHGAPSKRSVGAIIALILAILFVIIMFVGFFASVVFSALNSARAKSHDAQRRADISVIMLGLENYAVSHNMYPQTLTALETQDNMPSVPVDPVTKTPYVYQPDSTGESYKICTILDDAKSVSASQIKQDESITNSMDCRSSSLTNTAATTQ